LSLLHSPALQKLDAHPSALHILALEDAPAILVPSTRDKGEDQIVSSSDAEKTPVARPQPEYVQGIVERVAFHSEESGYTIARLKVQGVRELVTIVGRFPEIHAGQTLRLTGYYRDHPKYGQQLQVLHA
jgi:hypothetical protein